MRQGGRAARSGPVPRSHPVTGPAPVPGTASVSGGIPGFTVAVVVDGRVVDAGGVRRRAVDAVDDAVVDGERLAAAVKE